LRKQKIKDGFPDLSIPTVSGKAVKPAYIVMICDLIKDIEEI
jgi:hypothetical protein